MREHAELRAILPQAAPMVLLDRVELVEPGRSLRAYKAVSGSEPCYLDLPAGLPRRRWAYPVSLLLESFGQAAAVLWASRTGRLAGDDEVLMFAAARDCAFPGAAYPGDVVRHEVTLDSTVAGTGFATGASWVGDRLVGSYGSFVAVVRPASVLPEPAEVP
jgi:3-hydroxyacyl-[acyl-carrier-protein] dehydratase